MRAFRYALFGVLALTVAGCNQPLTVDNTNNPDRDKALASVTDLENFLSTTYAVMHSGTLGGGGGSFGLQPQLLTQGMENVSGLANFAMGPVSAIPRNQLSNFPGAQGTLEAYRDFLVVHRAARLATLALVRLQTLSLGSPARDARARAFARFVQGVALGNLALAYDSAVIVTETNSADALISLSDYKTVMTTALAYLDSAITIATNAPAGGDGFPLPTTWINGRALTAAQFIQFARSYKARFRAGVARTPAERADVTAGGIVDWTKVIGDANAGISADFNITMDPTNGWDVAWVQQHYAGAEWHQMSQFFIGMADTAGLYDPFLAAAPASRLPFVIRTPDRRFPAGNDRPAQQAVVVPGNFSTVPYFQNRATASDRPGDPLQISQYDYVRSLTFSLATRVGPYPVMTRAEIRLLAAEGYLRAGNVAQAAILIDSSRVGKGVLPALAGVITDTLTAVPGGTACVPRVPDPASTPAYARSKCGNIWEALKWEYRLETAYTGYGMWFFAGRGWGDLPQGTAVHRPVPYQELQVRIESFYGLGGVGGAGGSGKGNYGLFQGGVY